MKKKILLIVSMLLFMTIVRAAYFERIPYSVSQPDGTKINCFISGDEFFSWIHDETGYTFIQAPDGYFYYAEQDGDLIKPSKYLVNSVNPDSVGLNLWIKISKAEYQSRHDAMFNYESESNGGPVRAPLSGTMNNLAVYIRFSDDAEFSTTRQVYDDKFNPITGVALKSYFKEVSYNNLTINTTHYPACALTTNLSYQDYYPRSYYQPYNATTNPTGYNGASERMYREHTLLVNAIDWINSNSPVPVSLNIDADNDNNVDNVCFIIKGNSGGWSELLWAHRWSLYSDYVYIYGKRVYDYTFQPENQVTVRTLCHEMFHALGAPDLYHYNDGGLNIHSVGNWDLMESGSGHMSAYMKWKYSDQIWITSIPEITTSGTYTLNPLSSSANNCFKIASPNSANEYFVVEYRSNIGTFETNIPGSGLVVYRIDTLLNGNANGPPDEVYIYRPNGTTTANGVPDNAYFSAAVGRISINDTTNPGCFLQNGNAGGLKISNVTAAGTTISFDVTLPAVCTPPSIQAASFTTSAITSNAMTIGWTRGNGTSVLIVARQGGTLNIAPTNGTSYIANAAFGSGTQTGNGNYVVYNGTGTSVNITALTSITNYIYSVYEFNATGFCYKIPALAGTSSTTGTGNVIWPQSFEETVFPPTGWSVQNPIGGSGWENTISGTTPVPGFISGSVTSCLNGGYKMAMVNYLSGNTTSNNQWLISPQINIAANQNLRFQLRKYGGYNDTIYIKVSNTGNQLNNFTYLLATVGLAPNDSGWIEYNYSLATFSGQQIYIAFNENISDNNNFGATLFLDMVDIINSSPVPFLSVLPISQNVSYLSGSSQFSVSSNISWNAVSNQTWCTVNPSGSGIGTVTANYTANTTTSVRTATITISGTGVVPVLVTLIQNGTGSLVWPQSFEELNFPPSGWTKQNTIADTSYQWKRGIIPQSGFNCASIEYNPLLIAQNEWLISPAIDLTTYNLPELKFWWNMSYYWSISPHNNYDFRVNVSTNGGNFWTTIWTEDSSGVFANYSYQETILNLNNYASSTNFKVAFQYQGTDGGALNLDMINLLNNTFIPTLLVTPLSQNVSSNAGFTTFDISSNITWNAVSNQTWCTVTPSGSGNGTATVNFTTNTSTFARTATITITGIGVTPVLITVIQSGIVIPDPAGIINGLIAVCQVQNYVVYSVPIIANATSYIWTLPIGASGSSLTNTIIVNFGISAISGNITVKGNNDAGSGIQSSLPILINPLPLAAGSISGLTTLCQGQSNVIYTVPVIANAVSYIWTIPNGATGNSTTNNITVNYNSNATSGNLFVKGQNSCGEGTMSTIMINVNSIPQTPTVTLNANTLISSVVSGNQWYNSVSGIVFNETAQTFLPPQSGDYFVIVTLNGCSSGSSDVFHFVINGIEENVNNTKIDVYPNPVADELIIESKGMKDKINFEIYNSIGQIVFKGDFREKTVVQSSNFTLGIYLIKLEDGKTIVYRKIIKD